MQTVTRVRTSRLIEKMNQNPEFAWKVLGLTDYSRYKGRRVHSKQTGTDRGLGKE